MDRLGNGCQKGIKAGDSALRNRQEILADVESEMEHEVEERGK